MLPIQPRPMNWNHALSTSLYRAPVLAGTPRVPIDILVPFDPTTDPSTKPDSAADSSHPGPLIVGAKHTLKHAVRSIQFNMGGTDPKYADTPSVGYQAHKTKLTNYKGFTREADIHANSASWFEASDKLKAHQNGEARAGDYKDYVAKGPLLGRLLRGTESESGSPQERLKRASNSKQDEDQEAVNSAHPALEIADQALSQNAELGQVARQFVLHAIRDRVEPPAAPAPASDTKSAAPAASKGNAKGSPEKK
ncbi:hypothetical protein OC846_003195 [Tilletia horrida]|uniref:Uncharacterized protein n=1 Tax=Tilletia horrida TaxID=155126 RepID=A0AAN6GQW1_9BASI|nr:hypothetical protein OC846_003195 [Tilletia horrida]KAK0569684.1 hypothetical protein OC861_000644 [Tilletia horrida]